MTTKTVKEHLNNLIYSYLTDQSFVTKTKAEIKVSALKQRGLVDDLQTCQLSGKKWQRYNATRFYQGFKFTRNLSDPDLYFQQLDNISSTVGFHLNFYSSFPSVSTLGDEEQVKYWQNEMLKGRILMGYGQTELGHGSDLKALQTTATYHPQTQSWILNSPTTTSIKFYIGLLGHYATHLLLMAKAYVGQMFIGMHGFVVQIRNTQLQVCEGLQIFDAGNKLGIDLIDNGCIILNHKRVPRRAMLMRFIKVQADGTVGGLQNIGNIKYAYGHMLILRVKMVFYFARNSIIKTIGYLFAILKQQGLHNQPQNKRFIIDKLCLGIGLFLANTSMVDLFQEYLLVIGQKYGQD